MWKAEPTAVVDATLNPLVKVHSGARHLAIRFSRLVVDGRVHHIIVSIERISAPRLVPHTIEVPVLDEDTFAKRLAGETGARPALIPRRRRIDGARFGRTAGRRAHGGGAARAGHGTMHESAGDVGGRAGRRRPSGCSPANSSSARSTSPKIRCRPMPNARPDAPTMTLPSLARHRRRKHRRRIRVSLPALGALGSPAAQPRRWSPASGHHDHVAA